MAFLALLILERGVGRLGGLVTIKAVLGKVNDNVLDTVEGLGIEKVERVLRSWEMAVHAVRHKTLPIIHMRRGLPGIVGKLDFVAPSTEFRCRCAHHAKVSNAEKWKGDDYASDNENDGFDKLFHGASLQQDVRLNSLALKTHL